MHADAQLLAAAANLALSPAPSGMLGLQRLIENPFGNYVLQTLIKKSAPTERALLVDAVRRASGERNFGRLILARLGEAQ